MTITAEPLADSVPVAAARMGISRSAAYLELRSGRLSARKVGSRTIVPREAQQAWLNSLPAMSSQSAA